MPVKIFFCYSHVDEMLLNKLKAHLKPLQRQGFIDVWHDRDISAGTEWEQEIKEQLNTAQIILLLVSADFMDSDYCYSVEMQRAIERHERGEARVIPIILRQVYWQGVFGKLQALPKDAIPILSSGWHYQDEAFFNVTEGIRKAAEEVMIKLSPSLRTLPIQLSKPEPPQLPSNVSMDEPEQVMTPKSAKTISGTKGAIMELTGEQSFFLLTEEVLEANFFGFHIVQVDAAQTWLLYRDGVLIESLSPGRHSWWSGFFHKWRVVKINNRVELLRIQVNGRINGPSRSSKEAGGTDLELGCDVTAELELTCKIANVENFIRYGAPLSIFLAAMRRMGVEFIGRLSYDQYSQWAIALENSMKQYLGPGGGFDAERGVGIRVFDVFVTDFKPHTVQDRNILTMYQMIERGKLELVEAQSKAESDRVVAESFAEQSANLNIAPSILSLQNSPIGRALIEHDGELRRLMVETGINPNLSMNAQSLEDQTGS